jgi:hypothetical protein
MDLTTAFMPGAQSLVTAILTDTWAQARTTVAKLWSRRGGGSGALDQASRELDAARSQALELAGSGTEAERADRMRLFWAGYLAGQAAARPELAAMFAELPTLLSARTSQAPSFQNNITGKITGTAVQTGDIHGDFNINR